MSRFEFGQELPSCEVIAKNYGVNYANRIHSDEGAAKYGFARALVPGVGLYAYLTRPAVKALGQEWLERGAMSAKFVKPIFDGEKLQARAIVACNHPLELKLELVNQSSDLCAIGSASLAERVAALDPGAYPFLAPPRKFSPSITSLEIGDILGSFEFILDWKDEMPKFLENIVETSPIYDTIVHPAFWIAQANEILMRNIALGPWIHTASDTQHYAIARDSERLSLRGRVIDLYERRRNELVVVDLGLFGENERPIAQIRHTAIIKLREVEKET